MKSTDRTQETVVLTTVLEQLAAALQWGGRGQETLFTTTYANVQVPDIFWDHIKLLRSNIKKFETFENQVLTVHTLNVLPLVLASLLASSPESLPSSEEVESVPTEERVALDNYSTQLRTVSLSLCKSWLVQSFLLDPSPKTPWPSQNYTAQPHTPLRHQVALQGKDFPQLQRHTVSWNSNIC
ncbi:hypothetical protein E2C01_001727 [Portunus trituberculatus]|uniref:Uncharacterized protein n=1 Tax=Portunus trituberculatus TaxID=210409 RepID=A0A5B7CK62_PORTR|nr:hypothetical protein [Portunus trituberculatus]